MEFHSALAMSEGEVYRGVEGLRSWARNADATWSEFRIEIEEIHDVGDDRIVAVLHLTGLARASGIPLDMRIGQVWTWRDGLVWRNASFTDPREAFRRAGLEP